MGGEAKFVIGMVIAFSIGAATRYFDIPAPAPNAIKGALLVVAMTGGFVLADLYLKRAAPPAPPQASTVVAPSADASARDSSTPTTP